MTQEHERKRIHYTVDGIDQYADQKRQTPRQIVQEAGLDPDQRYLIKLEKDGKQVSYKDTMTTPIELKDGDEFITASTGPTPLS